MTATQSRPSGVAHVCDTGHFDRSVCPEPCGSMHSYCSTCNTRQDPCAHEAPSKPAAAPAADSSAADSAAVGDVAAAVLAAATSRLMAAMECEMAEESYECPTCESGPCRGAEGHGTYWACWAHDWHADGHAEGRCGYAAMLAELALTP